MRPRFSPPDPSKPPRIILLPRAAPQGTLRVWVGALDREAPPQDLDWRLNDKSVVPTALHPGGGSLRAAHSHGSQSFTGTFEIADNSLTPGRLHEVSARENDQTSRLLIEPLPPRIPAEEWFRILLVSCFHRAEDPKGIVGEVVAGLPETRRPQLTFLMGDQVYLDLPTIRDFPNNEAKLANIFEADYRTNWRQPQGYSRVLAAAPTISSPDDHEYWNNFPHASPIVQNSWSAEGRQRWRNAAERLYEAFQLNHPANLGEPIILDVPPLSIMVLDNRSHRATNKSRTLAPGTLNAVTNWVDRLINQEWYGLVVTGQSLLDEARGELKGKVADRVIANYSDYPRLVRELGRLSEAGKPVLLLTGDVHWGRITRIHKGGRTRFYEIICSPSSLVTSIGSDQLDAIGEGFRRLFGGEANRWYRHSDPREPSDHFANRALGPGYTTEVLHRHRGNQVATLALRRQAGGLEMKVTYHPLTLPSIPEGPDPLFLPPRH